MKFHNDTLRQIPPFLKWAGGKQWITRSLARLVPCGGYTYFEPFLGGGSLFFAALPTRAVLSDINPRLIETYAAIRDHPIDVINQLSQWRNAEEDYYRVRSEHYPIASQRAAQFIYLNRTCWNGLYRVNKKGEFNVPFGNNGRPVFEEDKLLLASQALQRASIWSCDFEEAVSHARKGDFVYLDPPYTVLHSDNGFRRYNEKIFSWEDQLRLAETAHFLADRGCMVILSNADHPEVVDLYSGFQYLKLDRRSSIAANPIYRKETTEALFSSFNLAGKSFS